MPPYYAICDEQGEAVSFTSTLPERLRDGHEAVEVDGPPEGRTWVAATRSYGPRPVKAQTRLERARTAWPADDRDVPAWARSLALALGVKD